MAKHDPCICPPFVYHRACNTYYDLVIRYELRLLQQQQYEYTTVYSRHCAQSILLTEFSALLLPLKQLPLLSLLFSHQLIATMRSMVTGQALVTTAAVFFLCSVCTRYFEALLG